MDIPNPATTRRFGHWTSGCGCACVVFCDAAVNVGVGAGELTIDVGRMPSLPRRGCSLLHKPRRWSVNPLGGKSPTGEPDAGDPHVRFGGRGSESNRFSLPLSSVAASRPGGSAEP